MCFLAEIMSLILPSLALFTPLLLIVTILLSGASSSFAFHVPKAPQNRGATVRLNMGASSSSSTLSDNTQFAFQHKSILLTGASRGLGRSLAHQLSTCNPSLLILSGRDANALKEVQQECLQIAKQANSDASEQMNVEIVVCDLSDKASVESLASQSLQLAPIHQFTSNNTQCSGIIDVLINNGGISSRSSFLETKMEVDERLMQVNFFSGAALAKRIVPKMVEKEYGGGKVIWISSVQGKVGTPYRTSYAASKFAVQGYCEALRSELAANDISVHVVSPGYIRTNLSLSAVMGDGQSYSKMDETTANGADPDEVATNILNSVASGKTDFVVAATFSAKAAMWLKFLAPSFLERMLVKRFEKQQIELKKND